MLVITRKLDESVQINDNVEITVLEVTKDKVKLGFNAPSEVKIKRREVYVTEQTNKDASKAISQDTLKQFIDNKKGSAENGN